ncbi:transcriptional repressor LexA [Sulfurivirga sp.]|uniref:transcriptional repressor LexA n=1 Tax=Sulfurivirga sp. TaxID=2614236 RepID=UPI0025CE6C54|nr:transcriptional repressor LexA [Sulfurivirga sp.]
MSDPVFLIPRSASRTRLDSEVFDLMDEPMVSVPLLGWTSAGEPIQMALDFDTVEIPRSMARKETFALRVRGNSMIDEGIEDGDIVIIERRRTAENGESVIVRINGDEVTMKKLYIERDGVRLQPANPEMAPIFIRNEEIEIIGIVRGILRQP